MSGALILSVGAPTSLLLESANVVLHSAGYTVVSVFSVVSAIHQFQDGDFDLVLCDSTLEMQDRNRLTDFIHGSGSHIPVVCTCEFREGEMKHPPNSSWLNLRTDPDSLLCGIREALLRSRSLSRRL